MKKSLAVQIAEFAEQSFRRGYQHGVTAAKGDTTIKQFAHDMRFSTSCETPAYTGLGTSPLPVLTNAKNECSSALRPELYALLNAETSS